jgi:hypothetical protein
MTMSTLFEPMRRTGLVARLADLLPLGCLALHAAVSVAPAHAVSVHPSGRTGSAMAYDAARGQVVLFGGGNATQVFDDTWVWDGTTWTQKAPAHKPLGRSGHAMAYDAARG